MMKVHPAAKLMPLMKGDELKEFVEDIRQHGQRQPIVMFNGEVLDGRNRLEACRQLKIEPKIVEWTGRGQSPTAYVVSMNVARRQLTASQKAAIAHQMRPLFAAEAKARKKAAGGDKRSTTAKADRSKAGTDPKGKRKPAHTTAQDAAKVVGVSSRIVEAAGAVEKASPELFAKVKEGEITVKQAAQQIKKSKQVDQAKVYVPPEGEFELIVADPAWKYDDELAGVGRELPYPTQTEAEICAVKIPAAVNCLLVLWVTNAHLLDGTALRVLAAWGFTPKAMLTWVKDKIGMGRWLRGQTEHAILAIKGHPVITLTNQSTVLHAPRRANSEKPHEAFALFESLTPATSRLEMWARTTRPGWKTSGSELAAMPGTQGRAADAAMSKVFEPITSLDAIATAADQLRAAGLPTSGDLVARAQAVAAGPKIDVDVVAVLPETRCDWTNSESEQCRFPDGHDGEHRYTGPVTVPVVGADGPQIRDGGEPPAVDALPPAGADTAEPELCDSRANLGFCSCNSSTPCFAAQMIDSQAAKRAAESEQPQGELPTPTPESLATPKDDEFPF